MKKLTEFVIDFARAFDALRVIPRFLLFAYGYLVYDMYTWYKSIPLVEKMSCDKDMIKILLDSGVSPEMAASLSCTVIDMVGGPSTAQASFVTIIIGLSTAIIGLYLNSGPKWDFSRGSSDFYVFNDPPKSQRPRGSE